MSTSIKKPDAPPTGLDGSGVRVLIVHARWNMEVIAPLVEGTQRAMIERHGVKPENITLKSVPGSWELPIACQRFMAQAQTSTTAQNASDLISGLGATDAASAPGAGPSGPYDAVIAVGVLIKGQTSHFEYISESVSHALMRVSMDAGTPIIYGVLNVHTEDQALSRAGVGGGHNHGEDWGSAAVEMAVKTKI